MFFIERIKSYQGLKKDVQFITLQLVVFYCVFISMGITIPYLNYVLMILALWSVKIIGSDHKRKKIQFR